MWEGAEGRLLKLSRRSLRECLCGCGCLGAYGRACTEESLFERHIPSESPANSCAAPSLLHTLEPHACQVMPKSLMSEPDLCTRDRAPGRSATPVARHDLVGRIGDRELVKVVLMHVQPLPNRVPQTKAPQDTQCVGLTPSSVPRYRLVDNTCIIIRYHIYTYRVGSVEFCWCVRSSESSYRLTSRWPPSLEGSQDYVLGFASHVEGFRLSDCACGSRPSPLQQTRSGLRGSCPNLSKKGLGFRVSGLEFRV